MTVRGFLKSKSHKELVKKLLFLDQILCEIHSSNKYLEVPLATVEIIFVGEQVRISNYKLSDVGSGSRPDTGINFDFLQLCALGLCEFNNLDPLYINGPYIQYIADDFLTHDPVTKKPKETKYLNCDMPEMMREYYIDVFRNRIIFSLNKYKKMYFPEEELDGKGKVNVKKLDNYNVDIEEEPEQQENYPNVVGGYASILLLPALLALIYILAVVVYFVFIK